MAVTDYSDSRTLAAASPARPSFLRRLFDAMVEARMAHAQRLVANHIATLDPKTRAKYDLDRAIVGKNGVYVWPL